MKRRISQKPRTRTRMSTRILMVAGGVGISVMLIIGWMVFMNLQEISKTRASGTTSSSGGSNGEILTEFTWEKDPITSATLGPDAISAGKDAHSMKGGRASTQGLSAGGNGKNIDMVLEGQELFNQEGMDISIDYRGHEKEGYFISRGSQFYFGIENGLLSVCYRTETENGAGAIVKEVTDYELPNDEQYRTYRFNYLPTTGRGEITVNGAPIWSYQGKSNRPLYWKNAGHVMIGKNLNGDGKDIAILDNLVIRSTGSVSPLAETLLNFMLETSQENVKIHFSASSQELISSFTIERSVNGIDFTKIATLQPDLSKGPDDEYIYTDLNPITSGVIYYRMKQNFKNGKFITHPLSAVKVKNTKGLSIERVNPSPFNSTFDISYFVPKPGRVWIQLQDEKGDIASSKTFDAQAGKNVHVYKDDGQLKAGSYTLNIMYDNKKVSTKVIKI